MLPIWIGILVGTAVTFFLLLSRQHRLAESSLRRPANLERTKSRLEIDMRSVTLDSLVAAPVSPVMAGFLGSLAIAIVGGTVSGIASGLTVHYLTQPPAVASPADELTKREAQPAAKASP